MNLSIHDASRGISMPGWLASLICAVMLLALPVQRAHQFTAHFRTDEIPRSVKRHLFLAQPQPGPAERLARSTVTSVFPVVLETSSNVKPIAAFRLDSHVSFTRFLFRRKIRPSRASSQDPFV